MRILFVVGSSRVGGAERVLLSLGEGIRERRPNWAIDILVLCDHGALHDEYLRVFRNVFDGPRLYHESGQRIVRLVEMHGYYDICHAVDSFHLISAAAEQCQKTHFIQAVYPNVTTSPYAPTPDWLANLANPYSAIVTEFQANLTRLPLPGRPPHILEAIPNGIDLDFWTPGECQRDIDVTWTARVHAEKGLSTAMDLVPLLCGQDLRYSIITSEPDGPQAELRDLATRWPTFSHAARLTPEELRSVFRRTKIFLSTSKAEGMPSTPIQAAACGCRPFVPAIDGLVEVFFGDSNERAFVQPPNDNRLARHILTLLRYEDAADNPGWNGEGSRYARAIAMRYSVDSMVQKYVDLYQTLLATPL
jgi:glycosyltransferase involved in cell wall biosynthesis